MFPLLTSKLVQQDSRNTSAHKASNHTGTHPKILNPHIVAYRMLGNSILISKVPPLIIGSRCHFLHVVLVVVHLLLPLIDPVLRVNHCKFWCGAVLHVDSRVLECGFYRFKIMKEMLIQLGGQKPQNFAVTLSAADVWSSEDVVQDGFYAIGSLHLRIAIDLYQEENAGMVTLVRSRIP